ncbi:MAG: hypothetical protein J7L77_02065 [Clostridiales bacterium]|nr:hypothetical protein [Clostridiales bacterium]
MDEKQKILKMVEDGKITAAEALELIEALGSLEKTQEPVSKSVTKGKKTMFRIRIDAGGNNGKGKAKVNVNIPISVAKKLTSLTKVIPDSAKSEMEKEGFNIDELNLKEIIEAIENGDMDEEIVNIDASDEEGGAKVKIYVD